MSAAAAAQQLNHEARWNAYFARAGFVRCPHGFRRVLVACSQVEAALAWHVLQSTVGAKRSDKPEWVVLTEPDAAKLANCSPNGAAKALDRLEELGILHSEKLGRTRRYRVQLESWDNLKARAARQLDRKPPAVEDEMEEASATVDGPAEPVAAFRAPSSAPFILLPTPNARPIPLATAVRKVRAIGDCDDVSIGVRIDGETLELTVAKKERTIETPQCLNRADKSNNANKTNSDLRNMLNAELGAKLGPVDTVMEGRIAAALGSASIDDLRARISSRRRSIESWGLVTHIARDVAQAAPSQPPPQPQSDQFEDRWENEYKAHCSEMSRAWFRSMPDVERNKRIAARVKELKRDYPAAQFWTQTQLLEEAEKLVLVDARSSLPTYEDFVRSRKNGTT